MATKNKKYPNKKGQYTGKSKISEEMNIFDRKTVTVTPCLDVIERFIIPELEFTHTTNQRF